MEQRKKKKTARKEKKKKRTRRKQRKRGEHFFHPKTDFFFKGVQIESTKNETWKFALLVKRDEFNVILQQLWKRAMENMGIRL